MAIFSLGRRAVRPAKAATPTTGDEMGRLETIALALNMAANGLIVARWYIGDSAPDPLIGVIIQWLIVVFSVAAGASLDLVVVVTTIGRRQGRRGFWAWATAVMATFFSAAIAVDVYGGPSLGPYLHAANIVTTFCFMTHLAQPRQAAATEQQRTALVEQRAADLEQAVARAEQARVEAEQHEADLRQLVGDLQRESADVGKTMISREQAAADKRQAVATIEEERDSLATALNSKDGINLAALATAAKGVMTWEQLAAATGLSVSSVRRLVNKEA